MKARPVKPRGIARRDVEESLEYYLSEGGEKAAFGFIDELQRAYQLIARNPTASSSRYAHELDIPGLRSWPLKRYPHLVFFIVRTDHIDVWRVLNDKRDIAAWLLTGEDTDINK
ncbi:type II toxin-antitoxin system RelE/ParE family toxin [Pseudomonas sp. BGr12]|uniref:type II toxin-antitoxin system RelE/ParE family toxin n=1 Tax=unclassified Pseudomonas TaxID=196821 RepID=UPI00177CA37C|nr:MULTISPECIES: type II toxin-antitoxin system RelE/ParE family toxin [unclassified Pseudomonas]MBD9504068.1 type II toxin-antitoxin system RelE/ParE family toxin [Pseudomonas sp. PDM17]MBD9578433.1 type II toxin-antitoxin system RelE/ParE family toxin [Pseudomonas sp. PDM23]MBD9674213.1 type II toxin-antitoxin system RelE/ParE family toxin [Pseudomonas sp. PDM21]MDL2429314.1 type II toxin-antitoxin system RelE/ParE family toxin [Pseudomonas sp. BJa5]